MAEVIPMKGFRHPSKADMYNATLMAKEFSEDARDWANCESTQYYMFIMIIHQFPKYCPDGKALNHNMFSGNEFPDLILFEGETVWINKCLIPSLGRFVDVDECVLKDLNQIDESEIDGMKDYSKLIFR